MKTLPKSGILEELTCGTSFTYILNDNNQFLLTDYKILLNQNNRSFVPCMKMMYNGKAEIYYRSEHYKAFLSLLPTISIENFVTIVANLFSNIIEVKKNGFLSCQNIDISLDKIFVDPNTLKVSLIYIPVNQIAFTDYNAFELELRKQLIQLIQEFPNLFSNTIMQFKAELSNDIYTLEDLYNSLKSVKEVTSKTEVGTNTIPTQVKRMRIIAMNAPTSLEIIVDKPDYKIGKNSSLVDGVITFNQAISRLHCKVTQSSGHFFITDLGSANGTYVNQIEIKPNEPYIIKNGDSVRLANSDFKIIVE